MLLELLTYKGDSVPKEGLDTLAYPKKLCSAGSPSWHSGDCKNEWFCASSGTPVTGVNWDVFCVSLVLTTDCCAVSIRKSINLFPTVEVARGSCGEIGIACIHPCMTLVKGSPLDLWVYLECSSLSTIQEAPGFLVLFLFLCFQFSSVQSLSCVWLFGIPWIAAHQASLSITNSWSSLKLISIKSVMPSSHHILCRPLLLPPIPPSIRVFSSESTLHMRWPKYWSFSFSISPSNEHSGLVSFRMDWLDLLAVQESLKSLLQHHSSKASILRRSAFFTVQLSHPHMTTGKTIALTRRTFVGKVMSLLLNMLSR